MELAKERFDKALDYNPKYIFAHMGLTVYYDSVNDTTSMKRHYDKFIRVVNKADPEIRLQFLREFAQMRNEI